MDGLLYAPTDLGYTRGINHLGQSNGICVGNVTCLYT